LANEKKEVEFLPDGVDGGKINSEDNKVSININTVQLSDYLDQPIDFLKLNIEGQELPVLKEIISSKKISNVQELVLEYHNWPGEEQSVDKILELLRINGFNYLIHDFDNKSCSITKPPFQINKKNHGFV